MDPNQHRLIKSGGGSDPADESGQAGYWLFGGVVLVVGGVLLLLQSHASVAHFGGAMLILVGVALVAASIWAYSQRQS